MGSARRFPCSFRGKLPPSLPAWLKGALGPGSGIWMVGPHMTGGAGILVSGNKLCLCRLPRFSSASCETCPDAAVPFLRTWTPWYVWLMGSLMQSQAALTLPILKKPRVANIFQTLFTEFPVETALNSSGSFKRNLKIYKYYSLEHYNPSFLGESVYFLYITFKLLKVLKKSPRFSSLPPALVCIHVYQDL